MNKQTVNIKMSLEEKEKFMNIDTDGTNTDRFQKLMKTYFKNDNLVEEKDENIEELQNENERLRQQVSELQKVNLDNSEPVMFEDNEKENELKDLFSQEDLEKKTDLSPNQILAFSRAKTLAEEKDVKILNQFLNNYAVYAISKGRKGRKEYVEAFKTKVLEPLGMGGMMKDEDEK
ncbi:MAG: hypothetical protein ACOC56_01955 [Atribacterota bacterium]